MGMAHRRLSVDQIDRKRIAPGSGVPDRIRLRYQGAGALNYPLRWCVGVRCAYRISPRDRSETPDAILLSHYQTQLQIVGSNRDIYSGAIWRARAGVVSILIRVLAGSSD